MLEIISSPCGVRCAPTLPDFTLAKGSVAGFACAAPPTEASPSAGLLVGASERGFVVGDVDGADLRGAVAVRVLPDGAALGACCRCCATTGVPAQTLSKKKTVSATRKDFIAMAPAPD